MGTSIHQPLQHTDISRIYNTALEVAASGDLLRWRALVREARTLVGRALAEWRLAHDNQAAPPKREEIFKGLSAFTPLTSIALAGVGSGRNKFTNQLALFEEILSPKDWNRAGYTVVVELPDAGAFIYQALHGAMCLQTHQLGLAIQMVRTPVRLPGWNEAIPIWRHHGVMGLPQSLAGTTTEAWKALTSLPDRWHWIGTVFGDKDEFQAAVAAYYMALNVNEYSHVLATNRKDLTAWKEMRPDIPLSFVSVNDDIGRRGYRLLMQDIEQVKRYGRLWELPTGNLLNTGMHGLRFVRTGSRKFTRSLPMLVESLTNNSPRKSCLRGLYESQGIRQMADIMPNLG